MAGAHATFPRFMRLVVAVGAVWVGAAIGAQTAAAELGLPGPGASGPTATSFDAQLSDVSTTLSETTAAPLVQATETLELATAPTLTETTEAVAPLLEPGQATRLLPATVETLRAVTESVVPPVAETLPGVEAATRPLLQETLPTLGSTVETTARLSGARDAGAPPDAPSTAGAPLEEIVSAVTGDGPSIAAPVSEAPVVSGPASSDRDGLPVSTRPTREIRPADVGSGFPATPSLPKPAESTTSVSGGAEVSPPSPGTPLPLAPGWPLSGLAPASASAGAGALVPLLAALAAALVLAVPGLNRRLRLTLAPWPQPILQLSLERPG